MKNISTKIILTILIMVVICVVGVFFLKSQNYPHKNALPRSKPASLETVQSFSNSGSQTGFSGAAQSPIVVNPSINQTLFLSEVHTAQMGAVKVSSGHAQLINNAASVKPIAPLFKPLAAPSTRPVTPQKPPVKTISVAKKINSY